jgi:hypothetical protein
MARAATALNTLPERVSVLEVQVQNIDEKIDRVNSDISANHTALLDQLKAMQTASTIQHGELAGKIKDLEGIKNKWYRYGMIALAFAAGAGWIHATTIPQVLKFLGI